MARRQLTNTSAATPGAKSRWENEAAAREEEIETGINNPNLKP